MKEILIAIGAIALVTSLYWNEQLYIQNKKIRSQLHREEEALEKSEDDLIAERDNQKNQIDEDKKAIAQIQLQIQTKENQLKELSDKVKSTNNLSSGGNNPTTLTWDINQQQELIKDLERQIRDIQAQESSLKNQKGFVEGQDRWSRSQSEVQLAAQIQTQEASLAQLKYQLAQAKASQGAPEVIQKYQAQVRDQAQFINKLKLERTALNQQWAMKANSDRAQGQGALDDLKVSEQQVKDRLNTEKETLKGEQKQLGSYKVSDQGFRKQMGQWQDQIKTTRDDLESLKSQLAQKQSHLSQLTNR